MALQLNIKIEANPDVEYVFEALPTVYFPVLWFQSTASLPQSMAGSFWALVNLPTIIVTVACIGIVFGLIGMRLIILKVLKTR